VERFDLARRPGAPARALDGSDPLDVVGLAFRRIPSRESENLKI
jgi:hypothetical protein